MARRRVRGGPEVDRVIHFYRANSGVAPGGEPVIFPTAAMAARINELDFDTGDRYVAAPQADVHTCCWVDRVGDQARLRLADVRRSGLPEIEKGGVLAPLDIPAQAGLAESVYIHFFPNQIVGAIFNFYGPRMSRLTYYLRVKAHDVCPPVQFEPLLRRDVLDRILAMRRITLFDLKIRRSYLDEIAEVDTSLGAAFKAAFNAGDGTDAEIVLHAARGKDSTLDTGLRRIARKIARLPDREEGIIKFNLRGAPAGTQKTDLVDVLSDELLVTRAVMLQDERTRALNSASAFNAIEGAYEEMRGVLEVAAAAGEVNG